MRSIFKTFVIRQTLAVLMLPVYATLVEAQGPVISDAHVTSGSTTSEGAANKLNLTVAQGRNPAADVYLKLSLDRLPAGAKAEGVTKATLRLYVSGLAAPGSFDVYMLTSSWSEATISSSNLPELGPQAIADVPVAAKDRYLVLDVTSIVKLWLSGATPNHGLLLTPSNGSSLSAVLDSKESTATGHDAELQVDFVDDFVMQNLAANKAAIQQEAFDRQNADSSTLAQANAHSNGLVAAETAARTAKDDSLAVGIQAEKDRALAAETAISNDLAAESGARTSADTALQSAVSGEITRAQSAEAALSEGIQNEAIRLSAETAARVGEDIALRQAVAAESGARVAADSALQNALNAETGARATADLQLQSEISTGLTNVLRTDAAGRLGLGTSQPQARFHLQESNAAPTYELFKVTTSNDGTSWFRILNFMGGNSRFAVGLDGMSANPADSGFQIRGLVGSDSGNREALTFVGGGHVGANLLPVSTRPLFGWRNGGNLVMIMDAAGNLGLGMQQPQARFHVAGDVRAQSFLGDGSQLANLPVPPLVPRAEFATNAEFATRAASAGVADQATNALSLGGVVSADFARLNTPNIFSNHQSMLGNLQVNGRVGIATPPSSAGRLYVGAELGTANVLFYDGGPGQRHGIGTNNAEIQFFIPRAGNGQHWSFNTGGDVQPIGQNEIMRITWDGKVGIGTTNPQHALDVAGVARAQSFIGDGAGLANLPVPQLVPRAEFASRAGSADVADQATNALSLGGVVSADFARVSLSNSFAGTQTLQNIRINGNIGIGVPPPSSGARMYSGAGAESGIAAFWLYDGGPSQRHGVGLRPAEFQFFIPTGGLGQHFSFNRGGDLQASGQNELMRITDTGRVGIGTANPQHALDVAGVARAQSFIGDGSGLTGVATSSSLSAIESRLTVEENARLDGDNSLSAGIGSETARALAAEAALNAVIRAETDARQSDVAAIQTIIAQSSIPSGMMILSATRTAPAGFTWTGEELRSGDAWAVKSIHNPNTNGAAGYLQGRFYIAGGYAGGYINTVRMYDPTTNQWISVASMNYRREHAAAASDGSRLYVAGGNDGCSGDPTSSNCYSRRFEAYDPATNNWTELSNTPEARFLLVPAYHNGKLYLFGGLGTKNGLCCDWRNDLQIYDFATGTWSVMDNVLPEPLNSGTSAVESGMLYLFADSGRTYAFDPVALTHQEKARRATTSLGGMAASSSNGKIFLAGNGQTFSYTPATNTWLGLASMPSGNNWYRGALAAVGKELYFVNWYGAAAYQPPSYYYPMKKD